MPRSFYCIKFEDFGVVRFWVIVGVSNYSRPTMVLILSWDCIDKLIRNSLLIAHLYTNTELGTCDSRIRIGRFWLDAIRKWRADSKFSNQPHLPSYHKPRSLFNKKNFNRCAVVIEIYFMFKILCLCSKSIFTHSLLRYNVACSRPIG